MRKLTALILVLGVAVLGACTEPKPPESIENDEVIIYSIGTERLKIYPYRAVISDGDGPKYNYQIVILPETEDGATLTIDVNKIYLEHNGHIMDLEDIMPTSGEIEIYGILHASTPREQ